MSVTAMSGQVLDRVGLARALTSLLPNPQSIQTSHAKLYMLLQTNSPIQKTWYKSTGGLRRESEMGCL